MDPMNFTSLFTPTPQKRFKKRLNFKNGTWMSFEKLKKKYIKGEVETTFKRIRQPLIDF